jgi:hypothetical protein
MHASCRQSQYVYIHTHTHTQRIPTHPTVWPRSERKRSAGGGVGKKASTRLRGSCVFCWPIVDPVGWVGFYVSLFVFLRQAVCVCVCVCVCVHGGSPPLPIHLSIVSHRSIRHPLSPYFLPPPPPSSSKRTHTPPPPLPLSFSWPPTKRTHTCHRTRAGRRTQPMYCCSGSHEQTPPPTALFDSRRMSPYHTYAPVCVLWVWLDGGVLWVGGWVGGCGGGGHISFV